jgi:hypothetical protein
MNGFEWLLVLIPILVAGIYLLNRRRGAATPFNSIYQGPAEKARNEAAGASHQANKDPDEQRPRTHGGCCGITR